VPWSNPPFTNGRIRRPVRHERIPAASCLSQSSFRIMPKGKWFWRFKDARTDSDDDAAARCPADVARRRGGDREAL
jgi:hypothetical protein